MKNLIVTADDFGLTKSVNEGIALALKEGIVTTVGLIPAGEAFEDALERAAKIGLKEASAHLSFTETKPTLIMGRFYKHHKEFLSALLLKRISRDEIYSELKNQLEIILRTGIRITNLSSHEHIHLLPDVLGIFIQLAREYGIPSIRCPHGERYKGALTAKKIYRVAALSYFGRGVKKTLDKAGIKHPDHFLGFLDSGRLTESTLLEMLKTLRDGTTELVCHPGFLGPEVLEKYRFHMNCEVELAALTNRRVKDMIKYQDIKLIR